MQKMHFDENQIHSSNGSVTQIIANLAYEQLKESLKNAGLLSESLEERKARLAKIEFTAKNQHKKVLQELIATRTHFESTADAWNNPVPQISENTQKRLDALHMKVAFASSMIIGIPLLLYLSARTKPRNLAHIAMPILISGAAGYYLSKSCTMFALKVREFYWKMDRVMNYMQQPSLSPNIATQRL